MTDLQCCPFCDGPASYCNYEGFLENHPTEWATCYSDVCMPLGMYLPVEVWQRPRKSDERIKSIESKDWVIVFDTGDGLYVSQGTEKQCIKDLYTTLHEWARDSRFVFVSGQPSPFFDDSIIYGYATWLNEFRLYQEDKSNYIHIVPLRMLKDED